MMIRLRILDIVISLLGLIVAFPIMLFVCIAGYFDTGSPVFLQTRVGREKRAFTLIKFRTMKPGSASVASHLACSNSITRFGRFLRKTKLDELPQLINVIKGDMSLVGPRPNLYNQTTLIEARDAEGVYTVLPGITGLAQVQNIDMSTPQLLARTDRQMIESMTVASYFQLILLTVSGSGRGDAIK